MLSTDGRTGGLFPSLGNKCTSICQDTAKCISARRADAFVEEGASFQLPVADFVAARDAPSNR